MSSMCASIGLICCMSSSGHIVMIRRFESFNIYAAGWITSSLQHESRRNFEILSSAQLLNQAVGISLNTTPEIHNRTARLVVLTRISSHITPVLKHLYWWPVRQRTLFNVLVFIYKTLHDLALDYLAYLLHVRTLYFRLLQLYAQLQFAVSPPTNANEHFL